MKTKELIAALQQQDPEAEVVIDMGGARSKTPYPVAGEAFRSSWFYTLNSSYSGFREAKEKGETFPVVWL